MKIQINYGDIEKTEALEQHVQERLSKALHHVAEEITRVEAHLHDDKSARKGGHDQRCTLEARIAGRDPMAVEERGENLYHVINAATDKLQRAVEKVHDKRKDHV